MPGSSTTTRPATEQLTHALTEDIFGGDNDVVEEQGARVGAALAHIHELFADADPRGVGIHDEARHLLTDGRVGVRDREHEIPAAVVGVRLGHARVRDPELGAVDDVVVALLHGARLDRSHVGARARLRDAIRALDGCLAHAAEVLLLNRVAACENHRHLRQGICLDGCANARAAVGELLVDDAGFHGVQTNAAERFGNVRVHQTHLPGLIEELVWKLHGPVELSRLRNDTLLCKLPRHQLEGALLLRKFEAQPFGLALRCVRELRGKEASRRAPFSAAVQKGGGGGLSGILER